jgi:hypothetical protein
MTVDSVPKPPPCEGGLRSDHVGPGAHVRRDRDEGVDPSVPSTSGFPPLVGGEPREHETADDECHTENDHEVLLERSPWD